MEKNTYFEIENEQELRQAFEEFNMLRNFETELKFFKKGYNKLVKGETHCYLFVGIEQFYLKSRFTEVENPFKSEYPKEMLVWNDCSKNETKILTVFGVFKGQYITTHAGHFIGYDNAKDIEPKPKTINEKIKELQKIIEETQIALKQLKN